ncbi:MAG: hypothetical protein H7096_01605 [Flavobacterium sp.]|nr:hypothetical protein [Pedobacter sp.]
MMPENSNQPEETNEPLRTGENDNDDRLQDTSNSDAAADNARETERIQEVSRANPPALESDADDEPESNVNNHINEDPLTTQGSEDEIEENLSGTTNLTLEQLKHERDPGGYTNEDGGKANS